MPAQPLNIVLLGPPGAGKSTITEALVHQHGLVAISTGQRLRTEIKARTPLGRTVIPTLDRGDLVPDSLMDRLLRAFLETLDPEHGFLLDGYPRTMPQALGLTGMLADYNRQLDLAVALDVSIDEVVRRLSGRRICEGAGEPFPCISTTWPASCAAANAAGNPSTATTTGPKSCASASRSIASGLSHCSTSTPRRGSSVAWTPAARSAAEVASLWRPAALSRDSAKQKR